MKNTKLYTINCRYFVPVIPNDCFEVGHALDLLPIPKGFYDGVEWYARNEFKYQDFVAQIDALSKLSRYPFEKIFFFYFMYEFSTFAACTLPREGTERASNSWQKSRLLNVGAPRQAARQFGVLQGRKEAVRSGHSCRQFIRSNGSTLWRFFYQR